jgi:hypothetical protein
MLADMDRVKALAQRLRSLRVVEAAARRRANGSVDEEAWQIATGIADIEESTHRLFGEIVPRLLRAESEEEASGLLELVGEEYRHIMYHIRDTKLFDFIADV